MALRLHSLIMSSKPCGWLIVMDCVLSCLRDRWPRWHFLTSVEPKEGYTVCVHETIFQSQRKFEIYAIPHVPSGAREKQMIRRENPITCSRPLIQTVQNMFSDQVSAARDGGVKKCNNLYIMHAEADERRISINPAISPPPYILKFGPCCLEVPPKDYVNSEHPSFVSFWSRRGQDQLKIEFTWGQVLRSSGPFLSCFVQVQSVSFIFA